jgi:hypothetical protein
MELWLTRQPEWLIFVALTVIFTLAAEAGCAIARKHGEASDRDLSEISTIQSAALGLLALLLGFTFAMAASRFETRKELIRDEANALGTASLRALLLPEPQRSNTLRLMRTYAQSRFDLQETRGDLEAVKSVNQRAGEIQTAMWAQAVAAAERNPTPVTVSYVQSLNDLIDMHGKQVAAIRNRIPIAVFLLLLFVTVIALGLTGYGSGAAGRHRFTLTLLQALLVAAVITLVIDLHRPTRGLITVDMSGMVDARDAIPAVK